MEKWIEGERVEAAASQQAVVWPRQETMVCSLTQPLGVAQQQRVV